ncbi:type IV secretory system conjugative DNA transfer family protein [Rhodococcus wratislaviensis]|uniref:type IV secretory system conjugative DNA transfer family protein n=1 Tax=Rhodococcus wratislaviensis TaxID=44752 RepID=UPI003517F1CB
MNTPKPPAPRFIPYEFWPLAAAAGGVVVSVVGGGFVSGMFAGHGGALPDGFYGFLTVMKGLVRSPGDPAAAWPDGTRPGGPALTWVCIALVAVAYVAAALYVAGKVSARQSRRKARERGHADRRELLIRGLTAKEAVKAAKTNRNSLKMIADRKIDAKTVALRLGRLYGSRSAADDVFLQYRDGVMIEGATGSGKSWRIAWHRIVASAGFALVTSTKPDLLWSTVSHRLRVGKVRVFDPENITRWPKDMRLRWSLLAGCEDPETAIRRAAALVSVLPADDAKNAAYFKGKAAVLMRCYLYAAAHLGKDLRTVRVWAASRGVTEVRELLQAKLPDWAADLEQILDSKSDSSDDVLGSTTELLASLASPRLLAAVDVPIDESEDLEKMVAGPNTVYLVSDGKTGSCRAFTSVLAAEIYHLGKKVGRQMPQERLDPPMSLVLDEVNNVAPIPDLPSLITDSGGGGISIWAFSHGELQNKKRWGTYEGEMFTTTSPVRVILPGLMDDAELGSISRLLGDYEEWITPHHAPRSRPVMSIRDLREMPADQAIMLYRGAAPALVHLPTVWALPAIKAQVDASEMVYNQICEDGELPDWAAEASEPADDVDAPKSVALS